MNRYLNSILQSSVCRCSTTAIFCWGLLVMLFNCELKADSLDPVPWESGERMFFNLFEKENSSPIGNAVLTIAEKGDVDRALWQIKYQTIFEESTFTLFEVNQRDFLPVYSQFSSVGLGGVKANYSDEGVSVEHRLKQNRKRLKLSDHNFDLYQICYLMRQFPVEKGYQRSRYIVSSRSPMKEIPTVMRVVDIETLSTNWGDVLCYRVDVKLGRERRSFWYGVDDQRLLYRIEDDGGQFLELTQVDHISDATENVFLSDRFDYEFSMPRDWFAFAQVDSQKHATREHVQFMVPEAAGEFSLIRHKKFGTLESVVDGSIAWLTKNRKVYGLSEKSMARFQLDDQFEGGEFFGIYSEEGEAFVVYNGILVGQEDLFIFTGTAPSNRFDELKGAFSTLVRSLRKSEKGNQ